MLIGAAGKPDQRPMARPILTLRRAQTSADPVFPLPRLPPPAKTPERIRNSDIRYSGLHIKRSGRSLNFRKWFINDGGQVTDHENHISSFPISNFLFTINAQGMSGIFWAAMRLVSLFDCQANAEARELPSLPRSRSIRVGISGGRFVRSGV